MARQRDKGHPRQAQDFYATPAWVTEVLLREVPLPNGIWEPCCGKGDMSRVLEARGHSVVSTDLVYRGYGEGGRDFMKETSLPDGVTAIVTNPPYALYGEKGTLHLLVAHALELLRPVGGKLALLVNSQWPYGGKNSILCRDPAYDISVCLIDRIAFFTGPDGKPPKSPQENHLWAVWDCSRAPGRPHQAFVLENPESEQRTCAGCETPLPPRARIDMRHCSDACRQRAKRSRSAQHRDTDSTAGTESRERPWPAGGGGAQVQGPSRPGVP
jgi:hypothetical protein